MKISNEERREIAAGLRENAGLSSRLPNEYSIEVKSALVLSKLLDCIDRPTCRNIYIETEGMSGCENGFKCSECGNMVEDYEGFRISGEFNYCSKCGREVVE